MFAFPSPAFASFLIAASVFFTELATPLAAELIGDGTPSRYELSDADDDVRHIYDQGLPPIEQRGPVVGHQSKATEGLQVRDYRGRKVAREATFTKHDGSIVAIGDYLDDVPLLLCLNYSRCPMLCGQQQKFLADGLRDLRLKPGEEYRFVSVSIDPVEVPETAADTRRNFLRAMGRPESTQGVDFLVGKKEQIDALADSVGFEYRYVPEQNEFAHLASMMVITPEGYISRYLNGFYGTDFKQKTLRLSLVEASDGKVSSFVDTVTLYCFAYDNERGKYTLVAWRVMRLGAIVTVLVLAGLLVPVWLKASWQPATNNGYPADGQSADEHPAETAGDDAAEAGGNGTVPPQSQQKAGE